MPLAVRWLSTREESAEVRGWLERHYDLRLVWRLPIVERLRLIDMVGRRARSGDRNAELVWVRLAYCSAARRMR